MLYGYIVATTNVYGSMNEYANTPIGIKPVSVTKDHYYDIMRVD